MSHAAAQHQPRDDHGPGHDPTSGHGAGHDPNLAHHFDSLGRQYASAKTGMWVFLATEVLMFGGLFCAYAVYRRNHPEIFQIGHVFLDRNLGALNTVILLLSSFTMAWAVRAAQTNQKRLTVTLLSLTLLGAAGFMSVKYIEYAHKIHLGIAPGSLWNPGTETGEGTHAAETGAAAAVSADHTAAASADHAAATAAPASTVATTVAPGQNRTTLAHAGAAPAGMAVTPHAAASAHVDPHYMTREKLDKAFIFFSIYYLMTGLHGIHVLVGMGVIIWLIIRASKGEFNENYFTPVDLGGLYWHIVDLIWIFLFPLLYLIH